MARASALLAVIVATLLCIHSDRSFAGDQTAAGTTNDATEIYSAFLSNWVGDSHSSVNVSNSANAPTSQDIEKYSDCAKEDGSKDVRWLASAPVKDLSNTMGNLPNVHFVDPKTWSPQDPGDLIAKGQPVRSAVEAGFAHGLMTFSSITFNASHDTAVFTYSFVCGSLCGNGRIVIFKKTTKGWTQSKSSCGSWIS